MPVKILVADDSATMRSIMEMTFAGEDAEIVTVDNGNAALQRVRELRPDVVFADASMNGVDGYELARAVKSDPGTANAAVIVLTSQFHAFDEVKAKGAGVDGHVDKPFDSQVAIDKVGEVLARPRIAASAAAAPPAAPQVATPPAAPVRSAAPPRAPSRQAPPPPSSARKSTVAFGSSPAPSAGLRRPAAPQRTSAAAPAPSVAKPAAAAPQQVAVSEAAATGDLAMKLQGLGLTGDQVHGVLALSREVIERVVWEVVPDLAETMIKEEIRRLTAE